MFGVDASAAREWVESAGSWLRSRAEQFEDEFPFTMPTPRRPPASEHSFRSERPFRSEGGEDPLRSAAPHPLDMPTDEQGIALGRARIRALDGRARHGCADRQGRGPRTERRAWDRPRATRSRLAERERRDHAGRSPRPQPLARGVDPLDGTERTDSIAPGWARRIRRCSSGGPRSRSDAVRPQRSDLRVDDRGRTSGGRVGGQRDVRRDRRSGCDHDARLLARSLVRRVHLRTAEGARTGTVLGARANHGGAGPDPATARRFRSWRW